MKFWKKILAVYLFFSVIISIFFGSVYYVMSVRQYREKEYNNLQIISNAKMGQMESMLGDMEAAIIYFLSDMDILNALKTLAETEQQSYEVQYFDENVTLIRKKISTYYLINEFYRIIVFNKQGNVISNTNYEDMQTSGAMDYAGYPWKEAVSGKRGKNVILKMHEDDWGEKSKDQVFSVVKEIQGNDMGYIEIQQSNGALRSSFGIEEGNIHYLFLTEEDEILYTDLDNVDISYYQNVIDGDDKTVYSVKMQDDSEALCMKQESKLKGISLLVFNETDISMKAMLAALPVSLLLLGGFLLLSVVYVYVSSRYLTRPIRQLQELMEKTHLDNMETEIPEKISNDEIGSLYRAYKEVMERLMESMIKEKRMSLMQLQAQFDLLQAQVNPHFIYNVLNVISNRGIMSDDEVVCEICGELAGMLRYATNTKEKYAKVQDEVVYLKQYLSLLKYRYDYRLEYQIEIQETIQEQVLPKIVLQQLVENSIVHGYQESTDTIEIEVYGYEDAQAWYLKVHDNGSGIETAQIEQIKSALETMRKKLTDDRENVELEIGGMGLVNTYARLYLLYSEALVFQIESDALKGTDIVIGVKKEGEKDVQNFSGR